MTTTNVLPATADNNGTLWEIFNSSSSSSSSSFVSGNSFNSTNCTGPIIVTSACALFDFVVYTTIMGTLCALGVVGNVVSLAVLLRDRGRSATCFLLQALAIADTLVLLASVPLYVLPPVYPYIGYLREYYNETYAHVMPVLWPLFLIPYTSTVFITVLVSMHRYCAVCRPSRISSQSSKVLTCKKARARVVIIAIVSIIYNIPRFFEYHSVSGCVATLNGAGLAEPGGDRRGGVGVGGEEEGILREGGGWVDGRFDGGKGIHRRDVFEISEFGHNRLYRIVYANILYFIAIHGGPLLLIGFFNVKLIIALRRRQQRRAEMGKGWYQQDITVVLVVVMCVFLLCQTPTFIDHVFWTVIDDASRQCGNWHYYYTALSDTLAVLNSAVNFVIYAVTCRNFRLGLLVVRRHRAAVDDTTRGGGEAGAVTTGAASRSADYFAFGPCSRSMLSAPGVAVTAAAAAAALGVGAVIDDNIAVVTALAGEDVGDAGEMGVVRLGLPSTVNQNPTKDGPNRNQHSRFLTVGVRPFT